MRILVYVHVGVHTEVVQVLCNFHTGVCLFCFMCMWMYIHKLGESWGNTHTGCAYLVLCVHGCTDVSRVSRVVIPVWRAHIHLYVGVGYPYGGIWKRQYMPNA